MFFLKRAKNLNPPPPPPVFERLRQYDRDFAKIFEGVECTVLVLNHEISWPAKDHYPFPEVELHRSTQNCFRPCVRFREETLPEELVKIMMQCYEHVLYKNDIRICELQQ